VHLQEVVTGAGGRELQKVEADAPAPPRRDREPEQEAGGRLMVRLDALACGTCLDELVDGRRQPRPPHAPASESQGLVAAKVAPERRRVQLRQHRAAEVARRRDAQAVAAAAPAVEEPVPEEEAAASGVNDPPRGLRLCSRGNRAELRICREGDAHGLRKVSMEEPGGVGPLTDVNKRCGRRWGGGSEELELGVRVGVPGPLRRPLAVLKALSGQKVSGVCTARDVHDAVLVLGEQVEPASLMVTYVALLLQPLQAGVVGVHCAARRACRGGTGEAF